jgi:molybdopterin converting factor small subunit
VPGTSVTVLFFAGARDAAGRSKLQLGTPEGTTVGEMADHLAQEFGPGFRSLMARCALWVNGDPAAASTVLHEGDELAVLPPVSGG